jgi:hypothetical protein
MPNWRHLRSTYGTDEDYIQELERRCEAQEATLASLQATLVQRVAEALEEAERKNSSSRVRYYNNAEETHD